jgi:CBS domain-containing protein
MHVKDIMTETPMCCTRETSLQDVAQLMCDNDCGSIPVVENTETAKPVGIVTDRDIACKAVATGKNPAKMKVSEIMSSPCITVAPDDTLEHCCKTLEENRVRRVLVIDDEGSCCGIVAQADIARMAPAHETAEVLREVSQPAMA